MSGDTFTEGSEGPERDAPRAGVWPYASLGSLFLAGVLLVAAWNVEIPYLAYSPGPVFDALDSIEAEEVPLDTPGGDLLMLTIGSQDVNLIEAMLAAFDPSVDIIKRELVRRPDETDEEHRRNVLQQMESSNFSSIQAALGYLGYEMVTVDVLVVEVVEGVPAAAVLEPGDAVVAVDGEPVSSAEDLAASVRERPVGAVLAMTVRRDGEELEVDVELAERDDTPGVAMIGIVLHEVTEPPFPISIRTGDVGGPSAGLMHALAIIDILTEGDLTRGNVIAGTGTIDPSGVVGAIGGVRQKVVAAEAAGATHMLVPNGNYADALEAPRDRMEIVAVESLEEALDFLAGLAPA